MLILTLTHTSKKPNSTSVHVSRETRDQITARKPGSQKVCIGRHETETKRGAAHGFVEIPKLAEARGPGTPSLS